MTDYRLTVYLSKDFRRTAMLIKPEDFVRALNDQCHEQGYAVIVDAPSHEAAAEVAFGIFNSYPNELHCDRSYRDDVILYRAAGHRSLSTGDVLHVLQLRGAHEADGWYGCAPIGWLPLAVPERP
jgi:hypothetical protein